MKKKDVAVTTTELADLLGVTPRTVTGLAREGVVVRAGRGVYLLAPSVKNYCERLREMAAGRGSDSEALTGERIRLVKLQADKAELDLAERRASLFSAAEIADGWRKIVRTARAALLAVPARCGSKMPHLTVRDVSLIDAELREALSEVAE